MSASEAAAAFAKMSEAEQAAAVDLYIEGQERHKRNAAADGAADPEQPEVPAVRVVTGANAMQMPEPQTVIRLDDGDDHSAVVCAVGEPMVLAAPGGTGKSFVTLAMALAAAGGWEEVCGLWMRPGPTVLVSYEDSPPRIGFRLSRMEAPKPLASKIHVVDDPAPLWQPADRIAGGARVTKWFGALEDTIRDLQPSLIVIDPISAALGGAAANDSGVARLAMRTLAKLSADMGSGVVVIAHDTKSARSQAAAGRDPGAGAVAGSAQFHDAARGVLYMHNDPRDDPNIQRELECIKTNNGPSGWAIPLQEIKDDATFRGFRKSPGRGIIRDFKTLQAARARDAKKEAAAEAAELKRGARAGKANMAKAATEGRCDDDDPCRI